MDPLVLGAFLLAEAAAVVSLLLYRRSQSEEPPEAPSRPPQSIPDPPIIDALSPVFITTHRGKRYHVGCLSGNGEMRYAIWTARSHELVRLFDSNDAGWQAAWDFFQRVEKDRSAEWIDHRGARRSRREWLRPGEQPHWPLNAE